MSNSIAIGTPFSSAVAVNTFAYPFSYGDASPAVITTIQNGKTVFKIDLVIKTAFDGVGASLEVSSEGETGDVMPSSANDPLSIGTYTFNTNLSYVGNKDISLNITPGAGASTGNGLILLYIEK